MESCNPIGLKTLLVGDRTVGKYSLMVRYCLGEFRSRRSITVGVDFMTKEVEMNQEVVKLQVWNTMRKEGLERGVYSWYYPRTRGVVLMYDITNRDSFDNLNEWIEHLNTTCKEPISMILCGTKSDLEDSRQVSTEEGKELANTLGVTFFEISSKDNQNIDELFTAMILLTQDTSGYTSYEGADEASCVSISLKKDTKEAKFSKCF
ncbi:unnamed protein product [Moneuplotes crassus]|uniref:Uncharacterized protein n=1 Tax=Euplotes crassus TaxID=5936 RepID=A0AAD2D682_EUPCR|nr:unnamed protein product [Moneuplotes crassus]